MSARLMPRQPVPALAVDTLCGHSLPIDFAIAKDTPARGEA